MGWGVRGGPVPAWSGMWRGETTAKRSYNLPACLRARMRAQARARLHGVLRWMLVVFGPLVKLVATKKLSKHESKMRLQTEATQNLAPK